MTYEEKIEAFRQMVESDAKDHLRRSRLDSEANLNSARATVKPGQRWDKVDCGGSGLFMVERTTGKIYGIKAYGVPHLKHQYGTLDTIQEFYWADYGAPMPRMEATR